MACLLVGIHLVAGYVCMSCTYPTEEPTVRSFHLHNGEDYDPCHHGRPEPNPLTAWACAVTADDDEAKVLEKLLDDGRELSIGGVTFQRVWYKIMSRFVTACLTRKGAEDYIARNGHNLTKPYIYVESLHRNEEMIALRNHLMETA